MAKIEKIDLMVEGGNAKTDPSMAQRLGPLKINLQDVLKKINEKTSSLKGIKIPVKLEVNVDTKQVDVFVGSPPTSELLKKEFGLEKGSATPDKEKLANAGVEQIIKVAKMKSGGMYVNTLKAGVKTVAGSANSMGILIEGVTSDVFNKDLEAGKYDSELRAETTELNPEKKVKLGEQLKVAQDKLRKEQEKLKALEAPAAAPTATDAAASAAAEAAPAGGKAAPGAKPAAPAGTAGKPGAEKAAPAAGKAPAGK